MSGWGISAGTLTGTVADLPAATLAAAFGVNRFEFYDVCAMSALPPKADMCSALTHVR